MSSSSSLPKQQQQQQQQQRRSRKNNHPSQQSRNTNAYFDRNEYHQHAFNNSKHYWNDEYYPGDGDCQQQQQDYYPSRHGYSPVNLRAKKHRAGKNQQTYARHSKPIFSSTATSSNFSSSAPPRRHLPASDKSKPLHSPPRMSSGVKPSQSPSSTSTNSDPQAKNLSPTAAATRQQNQPTSPNLGAVQTLMNSLMLQQQSAPSSTAHLQNQLTHALLATMIQQRLKEAALQAQAQHIQAALPTILAAQALAYQQQLAGNQPVPPSLLPANVAHPGTKFNNRPLVKFPVVRLPMTINPSRHRSTTNTQHTASTTALPTYQQVQEIERGISLDEAIQLKNAIDIADRTNPSDNNLTSGSC